MSRLIDMLGMRRALFILASLIIVISAPVAADDQHDNYVTGQQGMVATAHPLASEAALEMLKKGGNAIDAAVAAAFTIGVVEPDGSGLGGGGGMVVYLAEADEAYYVNYYHMTSHSLDDIDYEAERDRHSAKAVLVPGTVAGLTTALEKFGTLSLPEVLAPAIRHAEEGFAIDATLAQILLDNVEMLQLDSATAMVYLEEGFPRMEGDELVQPDLAQTLKIIAEKGSDGFYTGAVAQGISGKITALGGTLTMEDLASYRAEITRPVEGSYRGYRILAANVPQSGAAIVQALNMLENVDLAEMGHYSTNAETLHLMAETLRRTYADRWQYLGDPNFTHVPVNGLTSKAYARERFSDINPYKPEPRQYRLIRAGAPSRYDTEEEESPVDIKIGRSRDFKWDDEDNETATSYEDWGENLFDSWGGSKTSDGDKKAAAGKDKGDKQDPADVFDQSSNDDDEEFDGHTTHLSIIDSDGNMVALTQTLGTFFGAGITAEGVLMNCGMSNFSRTANCNIARAGMRPRSSISPTLVLEGNRPRLVIGSPGASRIICTVVEMIVNVLDFKMNAAEANWAPRFYCQKYEDYLFLEGGISDEVRSDLERMGHNLRVYEGRDLFFGGAQLIIVDPETGLYYGSADPRRGGVAIGY